jgi:tetratricopeptide (TPR) repeat protein
MVEQLDRNRAKTRLKEAIRTTLPKVNAQLPNIGIVGTVGAAAVLTFANNPDLLSVFPAVLTGIATNLISGYIERCRSANSDAERDALLQEIAAKIDAYPEDFNLQPVLQELNIIGDCIDILGSKIDQLTKLVEAGFATQKQIYVYQPAPVPALHQLPQPPRDFTGRADELAELLNAVQTSGVTISGLRGMGGVGKTALALKLAEQLTPRYPDAQFYLDLRGASAKPLTPAEVMAHIVHAYDTTAKLPEAENELRALYNTKLHGQRALLLLDNAAGSDQVEALTPPSTCLMIVTSRQHFTLPGLYARDLDALPAPDARALLLKIAPRIGDHAEEIARLCGYLPQALRLAASALAERGDLAVGMYIRRLTDATQRLTLTKMDASLSLSYDLLGAALQAQWRGLAVFPADFDAAAAAAVWALDEDPAQDALSELVRYSLVEYRAVAGSEQGRYHLHDLARLFADRLLSEGERTAAQYHHAVHYAAVLRAANDLYKQGGDSILRGLALYDGEQLNIKQGQTWAAAHAEKDDATARLCSDYPDAGIHVLSLRLHNRECIQWLLDALAAARQLHHRDSEGASLINLGSAYADLGDIHKAIEIYEQSLVIAREIDDRHSEGNALGGLGMAYFDLGDAHKAIEFYEQWLVIIHENGDMREEGHALDSLGNAYLTLGNIHKAIELYEQSLVIAHEFGDRHGEGNALGNLGNAYWTLWDAHKAIEFHKQALVIDREIGNLRGISQDLCNLGSAYTDLGDTHKAIEFYGQAQVIDREIGNLSGEATNCWNLGLSYEELGDLARAVTLMQVCVDYEREIGHQDADKDAKQVDALRVRAGG